jgi:hypothetical protein
MLYGSVSQCAQCYVYKSKCLANFAHVFENNTCLLYTVVVIHFPYYMMQQNK